MTLYSIVPLKRNKRNVAVRLGECEHPFYALGRRTNRLFDEFFDSFGIEPFGRFADWSSGFRPNTNVTEDEKHVYISAELPGMDAENIEISLSDEALTIKGEKKQENEQQGKGCHHIERAYGSFERVINLPAEVDEDKAEAGFEKGILKITLPKKAVEGRKAKRIAIKNN
jgi:HSP20 family protein